MLDADSIPARAQMRTRANALISLGGHIATAPLESHKKYVHFFKNYKKKWTFMLKKLFWYMSVFIFIPTQL